MLKPILISNREAEIIDLLSAGETTELLAERLGLSEHTVRTHVKNAMRKMEVRTRAHAVAVRLRGQAITKREWQSQKDISGAFGLTYASYLVVPRSVLEMMPREWQHLFVTLLEQIEASIDGGLDGNYEVRLLAREKELINPPNECFGCEGKGGIDATGQPAELDQSGDVEECEQCSGLGEVAGDEHRYATAEEVGFKDDNRANYRHPHHGLKFDADAYALALRDHDAAVNAAFHRSVARLTAIAKAGV